MPERHSFALSPAGCTHHWLVGGGIIATASLATWAGIAGPVSLVIAAGVAAMLTVALAAIYYHYLPGRQVELLESAVRVDFPEVDGSSGRLLQRRDLDLGASRLIDLRQEPALRPTVRIAGLSVPGFHAGLYGLRGGGSAVALLSGWSAVFVPGRGDAPGLLVSAAQPEALLQQLRG